MSDSIRRRSSVRRPSIALDKLSAFTFSTLPKPGGDFVSPSSPFPLVDTEINIADGEFARCCTECSVSSVSNPF